MTHLDDDVDGRSVSAPSSDLSTSRVWGMLESAPDGMLMTDGDGVILVVNQQIEALFGYDRADLLGREIEMLLPARLGELHRQHRQRYQVNPTIRSMGGGLELRARRSDGSEFPVEVSLSPLNDDDGVAVVVSIRDVSEAKRASARARRIQDAIDAVHDGVFMFETDSLRFVYANHGASLQTGYTHDELRSMTPLDIAPEYTRDEFEQLVAPLLAGDVERLCFRSVHRHKAGTMVPVDIVLEHRAATGAQFADAVYGLDSSALLVAIARDITESVAVERRLALSEETFRTSFENAPVGMTLARIDPDGRAVLEQVNQAFAALLGRSVDSLIGADMVATSHPDDQERNAGAAAEMAVGARDSLETETRYLRADGTHVWTLVHSRVIDRSDGARTLSHVVDITDRREREAARELMTTMEDRERIARDIHDLVIQRLFGAGMNLQAVIPQMGSETAVSRAHETIDELDLAIRELRSAIFSLHHRSGARSAADEVIEVIEQSVDRLGFRPGCVVQGPLDAIASAHTTELVATVREALANVARHAGASSAHVGVEVSASAIRLTVRDDGGGIDPSQPRGNGLANMATRAVKLGGSFSVDSPASGGCELTWTIPR